MDKQSSFNTDPGVRKAATIVLAYAAIAGFSGYSLIKNSIDERFPDFDPNVSAKVVEKKYQDPSDGIPDDVIIGPNVLIPIPGTPPSGERFILKLGQNVENNNGDDAVSSTTAEVPKDVYDDFQVGEIIDPSSDIEEVGGVIYYDSSQYSVGED